MSVKALRNQLLAAIAMVLVAALALGSSTFAWFSMNSNVTVTGMSVNTKVSNNLLIAETNAEANYRTALHQVRTAKLEPSSTVDGINYWYTSTSNVEAQGDAITDSYTAYDESAGTALANTNAGKEKYDAGFQTNYGITGEITTSNVIYGYIDYVFYLKATNAEQTVQDVRLTTCNLLYNGGELVDHAWRVAMFVQTAAANTNLATPIAKSDLVTILADTATKPGNYYFSDGKAISANAAPSVDVNNLASAAVVVDDLAVATTGYYKVTMRLWLEGEDDSCKNETFAELTKDYSLDLAFEIGNTNAAVTAYSDTVITVGGTGATRSVTLTAGKLSNGETPATYAWKTEAGAAATGTYDEASYTATTSGKYYCEIVTTEGNHYRTAVLDITVS